MIACPSCEFPSLTETGLCPRCGWRVPKELPDGSWACGYCGEVFTDRSDATSCCLPEDPYDNAY